MSSARDRAGEGLLCVRPSPLRRFRPSSLESCLWRPRGRVRARGDGRHLVDSLITGNTEIENRGAGIPFVAGTNNTISANTSSANGASGIFLGADFTGGHVRGNEANDNGRHGHRRSAGPGHRIEQNAMHGNGTNPNLVPRGVDRRDVTPPNGWIDNDCVTDFPTGAICTAG